MDRREFIVNALITTAAAALPASERKPATEKHSTLKVGIYRNGELLRTVELGDPREQFCNQYNNDPLKHADQQAAPIEQQVIADDMYAIVLEPNGKIVESCVTLAYGSAYIEAFNEIAATSNRAELVPVQVVREAGDVATHVLILRGRRLELAETFDTRAEALAYCREYNNGGSGIAVPWLVSLPLPRIS